MSLTKLHKRRSQKAGKLLGWGGQGCVYAPTMRCQEPDVTPEGPYVSKFTTRVFAEAELQEGELIKAVDPTHKFSVHAIYGCSPAVQTAAEQNENPLQECPTLQQFSKNQEPYLLFFPNAGIDLFTYRAPPSYIGLFFDGLRNLMRGLALFHDNNIVHMDIKMENMVTAWYSDIGEYFMRFIDFGFAFQTKPSTMRSKMGFWTRNYPFWPFESRFLNPNFTEDMITPESVETYNRQSLEQYKEFYPISKFVYAHADFYKNVWRKCATMSYEDRVDFIAKSTDVYAFGKTISILYSLHSNHMCGAQEAYFYTADNTTTGVIQRNEEIKKYCSTPFYFQFIANLIEPDPFKRMDAREISAAYAPFLRKIYTYFGVQKGYTHNAKKTRKQRS